MCVVWKNSRQFNEVILSQMDLFFIIKKKKSIWRKPSLSFQRLRDALLETNKHLKSREKKLNVEGNSFIFIYCFYLWTAFLLLFLS